MEEHNEFIWWMHQSRRLSSMMAIQDSASVEDVCQKRKLCYEYAKLKAKGKLLLRPVRYVPVS